MRYLLPCLLLSLPLSAHAGLDDLLKQANELSQVLQPKKTEPASTPAPSPNTNTNTAIDMTFIDNLTGGEINSGLKEALKQGTNAAVTALGVAGGFSNGAYKIPVPNSLVPIESILRKIGQGKLVDSFIASMNQAAEQAVPEAREIFNQAIDGMSLTDATNILKGDEQAATQYFQTHTQEALVAKLAPIVKTSMDANGVSASYKKLMLGAQGIQGTLLGGLLGNDSQNIDEYVTRESLNALFARIAEEEKQIRANPVARGSDLLKKVFNF